MSSIVNLFQQNITKHLNETLNGSGIDSGWEDGIVTKESIWINSSFHCMHENGYYDGWQDFKIRIPINEEWDGWKLKFCGGSKKADEYALREYLEDTIQYALQQLFGVLEDSIVN